MLNIYHHRLRDGGGYEMSIQMEQKYELRRSDHFPIIIEGERGVSTKQHQRWSIGRANWMYFQKESTIRMKMQDQNKIKEHIAA